MTQPRAELIAALPLSEQYGRQDEGGEKGQLSTIEPG